MNSPASTTVELCRICGSPDDADAVQRIYDAAPTYSWVTTGAPSRPGAAAETFNMLPDGCAPNAKHMYLVCCGDEPVGFVDAIRGYPSEDCAYIGLFILLTRAFRPA